ncbi:MAG: penicillin-binding protein 1A [bacterium]
MKRKTRDSESRKNHSFFVGNPGAQLRSSKAAILFSLGFVVLLVGYFYLFFISRNLPSLQQLEDYRPKLASKVYSADMHIIKEYYEQKRSFVSFESIPDTLKRAVIATEDRRFYQHWGMDLRRWPRIILINLLSLSYKQGASTITQQLAKQLYLSAEKTISRKLKEILTAIQIERTYTKNEILELYLNHMYFGNRAYGIESAAHNYFGKKLNELSLDECALLIGLLKGPEYYSPFRHPDRAKNRRNLVLSQMLDFGVITQEEYDHYTALPIHVLKYDSQKSQIAPYFTEYIRQKLQAKYGHDLYTEGFSIYTTLDTRAQACAEAAVKKQLKVLQENMKTRFYKNKDFRHQILAKLKDVGEVKSFMQDTTAVDSVLNKYAAVQTALISLDPRNGHILAWIGGRDFNESKFNRVYQARRQPGSAFKPFIYTVAIDNGYPTTHEELNQPVVVFLENGERWSPQNYDLTVGGPTTMREGLRRSLNLVTIRVLQNVIQKPSLVVDYAKKMGIKSPLQAVDAIALGASDVTPLEITSAYGVFANGGVRVEPIAILRVEDKNGNVLEENRPNSQEVLRKQTAYIMTDMLQTVINHGTGGSARWKYHFYRPAGGKTGTTDDYSNAWFVGFTPQIATGVWVGIDDFAISLGHGETGSRAALPIWAPYMKSVHDTLGLPKLDFQMPEGVVRVEICKDTKKLANDVCPNIMEEVFESEFAPTEHCDLHVSFTNRDRSRKSKRTKKVRF